MAKSWIRGKATGDFNDRSRRICWFCVAATRLQQRGCTPKEASQMHHLIRWKYRLLNNNEPRHHLQTVNAFSKLTGKCAFLVILKSHISQPSVGILLHFMLHNKWYVRSRPLCLGMSVDIRVRMLKERSILYNKIASTTVTEGPLPTNPM